MNWRAEAAKIADPGEREELLLSALEAITPPPSAPLLYSAAGWKIQPRSAEILSTLVRRRGRAIDKSALYEVIYWSFTADEAADPKVMDVHIYKIRQILKKRFPGDAVRIETIWNSGYRLIAPETVKFPCEKDYPNAESPTRRQ